MRSLPSSRRALRFAALVVVGALAAAGAGAVGCGPNGQVLWICLDPVTGKENNAFSDPNHYVNGVYDPCHCYDPSGPAKTCPDEPEGGPDAGQDAG
jgi:hypothetical protein